MSEIFNFTPKDKTFRVEVALPHYRFGSAEFEFRYVPPKELPAMVERHYKASNVDALDEVIAGWTVKNDDGEELPYSKKALGVLIDSLPVNGVIYRAWLSSLQGAAAKN